MAREMQWWQVSWSQEFSDDLPHSVGFGFGVLNVDGITIVRHVGRSHLVVTMREDDARAWPVNWGVIYIGTTRDPIDDANEAVAGQRWKIWSKHLATAAPTSGTTTTPGFGVSIDSYDFDVRGMHRMVGTGQLPRMVWRAGTPFQAGEVAVWAGTMRVGYLLP